MSKWAFLMNDVDIISGGTNIIFQIALRLKHHGITVTFITEKKVERSHVNWNPIFDSFDDKIFWKTYDEVKNEIYDIAIATYWKTYYSLYVVQADAYVYFVQSIESRFYPSDEINLRKLVDKTYELPMGIVTEAKWIKEYLFQHYKHPSECVRYGINKDHFSHKGVAIQKRKKGKLRALVEGYVNVPFKNVPKAIELCHLSEIEDIWLLTGSDLKQYENVNAVFSKLPINRVSEIYRSCDVIVKLSYVEGMFGPPLEMFHCGGTSVVYDITGHDEYIQHNYNSLVAPTGDEQTVIKYLQDLKNNPDFLEELKINALKTAEKWPNWDESVALYVPAILNAAQQNKVTQQALKDFSIKALKIYESNNSKEQIKWN